MPADYNQLATIKSYLLMTYSGAEGIATLKALATSTFAAATETVVLTTLSFEGGSGSGEMNCPKGLLLQAIMEVLQQLDPTIPRTPNSAICVFR